MPPGEEVMNGLTQLAKDIGMKALAEAIKAILRGITSDPEEQREVFNGGVERVREEIEAKAELAASKKRRGVT